MATSQGPDEVVPLESDENPERDSAVGPQSDADSTWSASITSSITGYKYENGRRYHAYREGAYYLPNDEAEQARLDLLHHISRLALDGALYVAPLSTYGKIDRCLDFGTGTGIWAIDFADEHPSTEVIGTDLSPIQPTWVPPNLKFVVDDVEDDWGYGENETFDFIHQRAMGGAIKDWPRLFQQIYKHLKPGGFVEMHEYTAYVLSHSDPELSKSPNLKRLVELINEASAKFGAEVNMGAKVKQMMIDAGFVDVVEKIVYVPIGTWAKGKKAKEMGVFHREYLCDSVDAFSIGLFTGVLGWTLDECQVIMDKSKSELRDPSANLYQRFYYVYGRKPEK